MTDFKPEDITYSIEFEIITHKLKDIQYGFDAVEIKTDCFRSSRVYVTKNEAIEAMITQLEEMKNDG